MVGKNAETAPEIGGDGLSAVIDRLVAGHEKNELFEKISGGTPYAAELNELIGCVNEELEYQRFRLRTVNEAVHSGMWYMKINADFSIAYAIWSDEFRRMVGFKGESDFPNKVESWSSRLHPEDVDHTISSFTKCIKDLSGHTPYDVDYRLKVHDGSYRWYHASGNVVRDKNGHPEEIIGVFVDIDADKKNKESLEQSTQKKEQFYKELGTMLSSLYASIDGITGSVSETTEQTVELSGVQEEITQAAEDARGQAPHGAVEDRDGADPAQLHGVQAELLLDGFAEDPEHQPHGEHQGERDAGHREDAHGARILAMSGCVGAHGAPSMGVVPFNCWQEPMCGCSIKSTDEAGKA